MPRPRHRVTRYLTDREIPPPPSPVADFFREEFVRLHRCLQAQREYFEPQTIEGVECALARAIAQIDSLSACEGANLVVARLLKEFDVVSRLSAWTDPHQIH